MIVSHVQLRNWKRYEHLEVDFHAGLNFILGANGSGKSSLLQGIAFALSGVSPPSLALKDAIRMGATGGASVSVDLNGTSAAGTITRNIDARGKVSEALHNEVAGVNTAADFINDVLGAAPAEVVRLLFVNEGDIYSSSATDMDLDRHLQKLLPIGALQQLLTQASGERRALTSLLKTQRNRLRLSKEEMAQLAHRRVELEAELRGLEQSEPDVLKRDRELDDLRRRVEEQRLVQEQLTRWQAEADAVLREGPLDVDPEAALSALQRDHHAAELQIRDLVASRGGLIGECSAIERSLGLLEGDTGGRCPLCEQQLSPAHRTQVVSRQHERLAEARLDLQQVEVTLGEAEARHADRNSRIATLHSLLARRPTFVAAPATIPEDIDSLIEQSRVALETRSEIGDARCSMRSLMSEKR